MSLLRERLPGLRVRVVNVVDLMALQPISEHPHGLADEDFDALFTWSCRRNWHCQGKVVDAFRRWAGAARVSVMSAFRFVEEFSKEGFVESNSGVLQVVRLRELMNRWAAAGQRRVLEIPMRWVLHRGRKALGNALRSYQSDRLVASSNFDHDASPRARLCLALFEAADALGVGFVHGVKPCLYLERVNADVMKELGLSGNAEEKEADLFVRIPGNRESVFRGVVKTDRVPVSDILQVWLDVSQHPSRGKEQGDLIWRKILSPAFELQKS